MSKSATNKTSKARKSNKDIVPPREEPGKTAFNASIEEAAERWPLPTLIALAEKETPDTDTSAGWKKEYRYQGVEVGGGHSD